jgi:AcrR family transcriptional regulator
MSQLPDFTLKKFPSQARSRATFEAIVDAGALVLAERGYAGTTTNHIAERAGVNISSLYAYFPGKDAIVAQVAQRLVERVVVRLTDRASRIMRARRSEAMRLWIDAIYDVVASERDLVAILLYQVPYTTKLPPVREVGARLVEFSRQFQVHAGDFVRPEFSAATLHLVINLVSSTILQLVLDPPEGVTREALLAELSRCVDTLIRAPT